MPQCDWALVETLRLNRRAGHQPRRRLLRAGQGQPTAIRHVSISSSRRAARGRRLGAATSNAANPIAATAPVSV